MILSLDKKYTVQGMGTEKQEIEVDWFEVDCASACGWNRLHSRGSRTI
jgi:hypothetical protein